MTVTIDLSEAGWALWLAAVLAGGWALRWLFLRLRRLWASRKFGRPDLSAMRDRWQEIEQLTKQPGELGRKMAIMEADKLLDHALKSLAMSGNTLGERLKFACYKWPQLRQVWWAHKIRNQLVHEASYHLDAGIARRALRSYRQALRLLGVI
jgi:hypothetical protein